MSVLRRLPDPYPYFRGIVAELGFRYAMVPYTQPRRTGHHQEQSLHALRLGVQGIVNHSKIPLRLATIVGFCSSVVSLAAASVDFVMKMLFWYGLPIGVAPLIIGLFCVASVQLFFLGVLGEYIGRSTPRSATARSSSSRNGSNLPTTPRVNGSEMRAGVPAFLSVDSANESRLLRTRLSSPPCSSITPYVGSSGDRSRGSSRALRRAVSC